MFSCAGRLINSFALIYSANDRQAFDRIVERMEKSFRPGRVRGRDVVVVLRRRGWPHDYKIVRGYAGPR
jgi:hypothetical protein